MAALSEAARKERSNLIFGQEPRDLRTGSTSSIFGKDIILAVEYNLLNLSGRDSIKNSIHIVAEKLIDIGLFESSKKKQLKTKIDRFYKRFLKECKRYSIDSRTNKFRVSELSNTDSAKFKTECNEVFAFCPVSLSASSSVPSSVSSPSSINYSNEGRTMASTSNSKFVIGELAESISSSVFTDNNNSSDDEDETESSDANRNKDPDFQIHVPKPRVTIIESTDPAIFHDGDRYGKSVESMRREIYRNSGILWTNEGLRKARDRFRIQAATSKRFDPPLVIGFDERRDLCKDKHSNDLTREENCTVILYPGGTAGHFIPEDGTGKALAEGLFAFCKELEIDLSQLVGLCSDGCSKMVGQNIGAHVSFEQLVGRELLRLICLFHKLEKSFSRYSSIYGLKSTGPSTLAEPWQSLLRGDLHHLPVANFRVIKNNFLLAIIQQMNPNIKLSKDHLIIKNLLLTVITGVQNKSMFQKIGPINMARFTTTETRLIRKYLSMDDPPQNLVRMVRYVVFVWAPVFLQSKIFYLDFFMGPEILLLEVTLSRRFLNPEEMREMIKSYNINGFYCHHENILMALVSSKDSQKRLLGVNILKDIRSRPPVSGIRQFGPESYEINPLATSLSDLNISPLSNAVREPAPLKSLSDSELEQILLKPLGMQFPMTSVDVERGVKETTRAALKCGDVKTRNGFMHNSISSRETKY